MVSVASAEPFTHTGGSGQRECKSCHHEENRQSRFDSVRPWLKSAHAEAGVTCIDCHQEEGIGDEDFFKAVATKKKEEAHSYMVQGASS